ncbi:MAG: hypothetical protein ACO1PZ_05205, partial [Gammaproteobacteria bacterium]
MPRIALHNFRTTLGRAAGLVFAFAISVQAAQAAPPRTFHATYNASYEGISADAERSLTFDAA